MCLATAYKESVSPENICMKDIIQIEYGEGVVTLIDIFGRRKEIKGSVTMTNFDNGKTIIREQI